MVWEPAKNVVEICAILVPFALIPLLFLLLFRPLVREQERSLFKNVPTATTGTPEEATEGPRVQGE